MMADENDFLTGVLHRKPEPGSSPPSLAEIGLNHFVPYLINSFTAAIFSTLLAIVLALPAAYALSLAKVPGWRDSLFFFLSTRMMPAVASILPLYILVRNIGMLDDIRMLSIIYTAMNLAIGAQACACPSFQMPVSPGEIRPSGETAVASQTTAPAPPTARLPR